MLKCYLYKLYIYTFVISIFTYTRTFIIIIYFLFIEFDCMDVPWLRLEILIYHLVRNIGLHLIYLIDWIKFFSRINELFMTAEMIIRYKRPEFYTLKMHKIYVHIYAFNFIKICKIYKSYIDWTFMVCLN